MYTVVEDAIVGLFLALEVSPAIAIAIVRFRLILPAIGIMFWHLTGC